MSDFVKLHRQKIDPEPIEGYLLARSKTLTLIQPFDPDFMDFNGYTVVRNRDLTRTVRLKPRSFVLRAIELKRIESKPVEGVVIDDWPALVRSAGDLFPVITIHSEIADPDVCFIGRPSLISARTFGLTEIDPDARWSCSRSYRFEDLTKVDFGGGYEAALVAVAETDAKNQIIAAKKRQSAVRK